PHSEPPRPRHRSPSDRRSSFWGLSRWGPATSSLPLCPQTLGPPGQFGLTPRWGPSRRVPGQLGFASRSTWPRAPLGLLVAGTPGAGLSSLLVPVLAQQLLVELAHRGARHLVDDIDFVGHLPLGEALTEGGDDVLPGQRGDVGGYHIGYGSLIPLLVGNADDCGFLDARVVEDRVLHVDG